ncbi:MAG: VOC family protein [Sorangiineae bacterium]|nr:VOC family protein [Polyangiaceae bacterium]MEB2325211.1 VOC family protein [Sorangiineae bacterium]
MRTRSATTTTPTTSSAARLHHLALGARDVRRVSAFYRDVLGLRELAEHRDDAGELRSVWLDLGGAWLMIERTAAQPRRVDGVGAGPFLLAVRVAPDQREALERRLANAEAPIEARTEFSSYARDPEGNRVAISHYPEPPLGE